MSNSADKVMIPPKKIARHDNDENQDRISDLPDCVLLHILSLLNSKNAVQTCVLSKRWKHLWKRIPTLILHSSRFSTVKKFAIFVSNILTLRDTSAALHSLDLDRAGIIESSLLHKVLTYVSSYNIHIHHLGISVTGGSYLIMNSISKCQALTSLKLSVNDRRGSYETLFPNFLNLPLLTHLDLTHFAFCGDDNGRVEPFSPFTKLNSLVICHCKVLKDAQTLIISSETLVNLAFDYYSSNFAKIELSTPKLCTFTFPKSLDQKICGSGLSSVKQVNIDVPDYSATEKLALVLLNWLRDLTNVESLTTTSITLQVLSLVPDLLEVKFHSLCNLKSLEIELIPFDYGPLLRIMENAMLKKAAAKSRNEAAKLRKTFKAGLRPPPIPDGIVDFLRQNSPSAKVNITTKYAGCFNIKQVEKSIKGAKITGYRSQYAPPAPANATEFASAVAPSPASAAKSTFADALASSSSPARAAPASAAESASADSLGSASSPGPAALAATPASAAVPASAPSPRHHLCSAEKVTTNVDNSDSTFWPDIVTKTFIDIMVDEVTKGNMSNGVFHTRTWTSMTNRLNSITNFSYEEEQLKAKMHHLRAMFHEFYSLLQNVGFVWNSETNTVTASEEVWKNYLKTHDKASQFQNKGCDHYKLLEIIFNKYNETEVLHYSIAQDQPNINKENEHDNQYLNTRSANYVCVDNDSSDNGTQEVECITCRGKQKIQVKDRTSKKESTSRQMGDAIATWAQAWGKIVEASSSHVTTNCSLTKCVVALEEIGDISDDIYGKALEKFTDLDWREMFIAMSTDRRRGWLFRLLRIKLYFYMWA